MAARSGETGTGSTEGNSAVANGDGPQPTDNRENIVTPSEQQAVPVAQEDRNFAADYGIRFGRFGELYRRAIEDGQWDHTDDVQLVARHRLAALPCKSGEGAGSMKPWRGGDSAPSDWDGGPVVMVDPSDLSGDAFVEVNVPPREMPWKRTVGWKVIVAYTPIPDATQTREAELRDRLEGVAAMLERVPFNDITRGRAVLKEAVDALYDIYSPMPDSMDVAADTRAALNARGGA